MNRRTFFGGLMAGLAALCGVKPKPAALRATFNGKMAVFYSGDQIRECSAYDKDVAGAWYLAVWNATPIGGVARGRFFRSTSERAIRDLANQFPAMTREVWQA